VEASSDALVKMAIRSWFKPPIEKKGRVRKKSSEEEKRILTRVGLFPLESPVIGAHKIRPPSEGIAGGSSITRERPVVQHEELLTF